MCSNLRTTILENPSFPAHLSGFQLGFVFWACWEGGEGKQFPYSTSPPTSWAHPLLLQVLSHLFLLLLIQDTIPILVKPGKGSCKFSDLMFCMPQSEENRMMKWLLTCCVCDLSIMDSLLFLPDSDRTLSTEERNHMGKPGSPRFRSLLQRNLFASK